MAADPHVAAVRGLLVAEGLTVYPPENSDQRVPNGAVPPYVVVDFVTNYVLADRLPALSTRAVVRAYVHCVGKTNSAAFVIAGRVRDALLDVRPTVAGRRCWRIRNEPTSAPATSTTTAGVSVVDITDVYRLESEPD